MTSGNGSTIRHTRRPGRSVRSTSQAIVVPMTQHTSDTRTASWIVRHSGPTAVPDDKTSHVPSRSRAARLMR
jgi:hypothetical protein